MDVAIVGSVSNAVHGIGGIRRAEAEAGEVVQGVGRQDALGAGGGHADGEVGLFRDLRAAIDAPGECGGNGEAGSEGEEEGRTRRYNAAHRTEEVHYSALQEAYAVWNAVVTVAISSAVSCRSESAETRSANAEIVLP